MMAVLQRNRVGLRRNGGEGEGGVEGREREEWREGEGGVEGREKIITCR